MEEGKIIKTLCKTASKEGGDKRESAVVKVYVFVCVSVGEFIFPTGNRPSPYLTLRVEGEKERGEDARPQAHN